MASGSGGVMTVRQARRTSTGYRVASRAKARARAYANARRGGAAYSYNY